MGQFEVGNQHTTGRRWLLCDHFLLYTYLHNVFSRFDSIAAGIAIPFKLIEWPCHSSCACLYHVTFRLESIVLIVSKIDGHLIVCCACKKRNSILEQQKKWYSREIMMPPSWKIISSMLAACYQRQTTVSEEIYCSGGHMYSCPTWNLNEANATASRHVRPTGGRCNCPETKKQPSININ